VSRPTANDLYREAQYLMKTGQPVFPCISVGAKAKAPMTKRGLNDATLDREQVRSWWRQHPDASLGIPTGIVWDVLDVDIKDDRDGRKHLPVLAQLGLLDGCQQVVRTPSGGFHLYFKAAPGLTNKAKASLGLDVRAKGGYVLAPPSFLETPDYEGAYENLGATSGATDEPLLWDAIVNALAPVNEETKQPIPLLPSERRTSIASLREWLSIRVAGERNHALFWAVCRCIESGIDPHELVDAAVLTGLDEDEVLLTVRSAIRRAGLTESDLKSEAEGMFGAG
jgi:hypothetical protein